MNRKVTGFTWLAVLAGLLGANVALAQGNSGNNGNGLSGQVDALGAQHNADIAAVNAAISAIELMPGPAGADGADGADGATGPAGPAGATGPAGPTGPAGADGQDGAPGADGIDGAPGADGVDGAPGADGVDGAPGADGVDGAPGADGTNGVDGLNGAAGPPGPPGADGTNGVDGVDGAPGADGLGVPSGGVFGDVMYYNGSSWIATSPSNAIAGIDKRQPYLGVNYIIALQGVYPSRSAVDPYLGEVIMFGGNFAPRGWAFCNGQLLPISSNSALFSLLGTTYGGDARTTFALPDLRGRVPVHSGNSQGPGLPPVRAGESGGSINH